MAETAAYPYATHLDIKFDPLTLIDVSPISKHGSSANAAASEGLMSGRTFTGTSRWSRRWAIGNRRRRSAITCTALFSCALR